MTARLPLLGAFWAGSQETITLICFPLAQPVLGLRAQEVPPAAQAGFPRAQ